MPVYRGGTGGMTGWISDSFSFYPPTRCPASFSSFLAEAMSFVGPATDITVVVAGSGGGVRVVYIVDRSQDWIQKARQQNLF